jgi:hypothetical protein
MTATISKPSCELKNGVFLTGPVQLSGYQACLKPSKFGFSLKASVPADIEPLLEEDRANALKWAESKLTNPKRAVCKPEPWVEDDEVQGNLLLKFSWSEDDSKPKPTFVDTEGKTITDLNVPLYSGSIVRLAFKQKAYLLKDGVTYGTTLKLAGVQVISCQNQNGFDSGDLSEEDISTMFGKTNGFKEREPNVTPITEEDDDF